MARTFEVWIPSLRDASTGLAAVSADVRTSGDAASGAAAHAGASCGGPLLAEALTRWGEEMARRSGEASTAAEEASTTMTSNADRYEQDDRAASTSLDAAFTDGPAAPW